MHSPAERKYILDESKDFNAFIAEKSPFSFKNPIFFSCPNNKQPLFITKNNDNVKRELFPKK